MLLCAALLLPLLPAQARAVTLTAVNDTLLPLNEGTMPARLGGEMYVPYGVFSSLGVSSSSEEGVLSLSSNGQTLSFSPAEGYVYDQNLNSYSTPAYNRNGTVYVPVKLCCGVFGLGYSTLNVAGETVLRVTDGSAQSDAGFVSSKGGEIENVINTYKGISPQRPPEQPPVPEKPEEPPIPEVEEQPTQKPSYVYLAFYGMPTGYTGGILDALKQTGRSATFFLPVEEPAGWPDDTVRRMVAEGHTAALLLDADAKSDPTALIASLTAANERLRLLTGACTRIISCEDGCDRLTAVQRDRLTEAGYRLWDSTMDSGDAEQSAERAYATTAQQFAETSAVVVAALHHGSASAQTATLLSSYMSRQGIPSARITLSAVPVNRAADTR